MSFASMKGLITYHCMYMIERKSKFMLVIKENIQ